MSSKTRSRVVITTHFALIWVTLLILAIFFGFLYYADGSTNATYSSITTLLIGTMVGLVGGREAKN